MTFEERSPERLLIDNAVRQALENAARIVESLQGNQTYSQAWRLAARAIRRAKPD